MPQFHFKALVMLSRHFKLVPAAILSIFAGALATVSDVSGIMSMENSSNGRGDAVRRERMLSLKRNRAAHLGYLNRLYKDVELLMQNADNYHVACKKKKEVETGLLFSDRCL